MAALQPEGWRAAGPKLSAQPTCLGALQALRWDNGSPAGGATGEGRQRPPQSWFLGPQRWSSQTRRLSFGQSSLLLPQNQLSRACGLRTLPLPGSTPRGPKAFHRNPEAFSALIRQKPEVQRLALSQSISYTHLEIPQHPRPWVRRFQGGFFGTISQRLPEERSSVSHSDVRFDSTHFIDLLSLPHPPPSILCPSSFPLLYPGFLINHVRSHP